MKKFISTLIMVFILASVFVSCGDSVPEPEIKSGEFDFSVTYEWNGAEKTVSGVYVCEYSGLSWALDGGYSRDWTGYIKDENTKEPFEIGTTEEGDKIELIFGFYPEYFMDDYVEGDQVVPAPYISVTLADGEDVSVMYDADEVEEYCGARIVSYEYAEPIENSFAD